MTKTDSSKINSDNKTFNKTNNVLKQKCKCNKKQLAMILTLLLAFFDIRSLRRWLTSRYFR